MKSILDSFVLVDFALNKSTALNIGIFLFVKIIDVVSKIGTQIDPYFIKAVLMNNIIIKILIDWL